MGPAGVCGKRADDRGQFFMPATGPNISPQSSTWLDWSPNWISCARARARAGRAARASRAPWNNWRKICPARKFIKVSQCVFVQPIGRFARSVRRHHRRDTRRVFSAAGPSRITQPARPAGRLDLKRWRPWTATPVRATGRQIAAPVAGQQQVKVGRRAPLTARPARREKQEFTTARRTTLFALD